MKIALIMAVIFIPLALILYYLGFGVTKAGVFILNASYSLPTRWEGRLSDASGHIRRNFVIFKKCSALRVEIETVSGSLELEVRAPDGSPLVPASGIHGQNASVLLDVGHLNRCSAALRMDHFSGSFRITLQ